MMLKYFSFALVGFSEIYLCISNGVDIKLYLTTVLLW